jgi:hypothetical protein
MLQNALQPKLWAGDKKILAETKKKPRQAKSEPQPTYFAPLKNTTAQTFVEHISHTERGYCWKTGVQVDPKK